MTDTSIFSHPAFAALAFVVLILWPVARILMRQNKSPLWALLLGLNILLPMLGVTAVCAVMLRKAKTA